MISALSYSSTYTVYTNDCYHNKFLWDVHSCESVSMKSTEHVTFTRNKVDPYYIYSCSKSTENYTASTVV